jgi:hypothetical protein
MKEIVGCLKHVYEFRIDDVEADLFAHKDYNRAKPPALQGYDK